MIRSGLLVSAIVAPMMVGMVPVVAQCPGFDATFIGGFDETVRAASSYPDGPNTRLAVGGSFATVGGTPVARVASWNGTAWSPLGSGFSASVNDLEVFPVGGNDQLHAVGFFSASGATTVNGIARWDGAAWQVVGPEGIPGGRLYAMEVESASSLIVAGQFPSVPNPPATPDALSSGIVRWTGTLWEALGSGVDDGNGTGVVYDVAFYDDGSGSGSQLYAAGSFTTAGGAAAANIAKWDGTAWTPLGSGTDGDIYALATFDDGAGDQLYAAGLFTTAGGVAVASIARWNGSAWSALGGGDLVGPQPFVFDLATYDDGSGVALYAAGGFRQAGTATVNQLARWTAAGWTALDTGVAGGPPPYVQAIGEYDGGLVFGGDFTVPSTRATLWRGCP